MMGCPLRYRFVPVSFTFKKFGSCSVPMVPANSMLVFDLFCVSPRFGLRNSMGVFESCFFVMVIIDWVFSFFLKELIRYQSNKF